MPTSDIHTYPAASTYVFSIPTPETGITCDSIEQNDTCDVFEQKNELGEIIEVVTFNPRGEITISGESLAALAAILGKVLTVANLITTQVGAGGSTIVKGVQYSQARGVNQKVRITATYYPLVINP